MKTAEKLTDLIGKTPILRLNRFAAAEKAFAVEHDDPAAAAAADLDIGSGADDRPPVRTAGMGFPGRDHIADENFFCHGKDSFRPVKRPVS